MVCTAGPALERPPEMGNFSKFRLLKQFVGVCVCVCVHHTFYRAWGQKTKQIVPRFTKQHYAAFQPEMLFSKSLFLRFIDLRLREWQPWRWRSTPGWAGAGLQSSGCLPGTLSWEHTLWQRFTHRYQRLASGYKKLASSLFPVCL